MVESTTHLAGWRLERTYARLPESLFVRLAPEPVGRPELVVLNERLAVWLGLSAELMAGEAGAAIFAGNVLPPGAEPIAQAYAGHQFGHFTGLGDGRAILLGEQITPRGERFDIQLKGSGRTPFSRGGDGRAALGPMLREYLVSEAMHALGIPTTRSLAVVATGEEVRRRETLPGAVLTRVAASHLRVGTIEWAAATGDRDALAALVGYTVGRHYAQQVDAEFPALALLEGVIERQAALIARWQAVGFIHGVMNTDNMTLSGETIDYGPCAFMDAYDPATVFSSIDHHGRYAYRNQPMIAHWNLARLGEALLPLIHPDPAQALDRAAEAVYRFPGCFQEHWLAAFTEKLGLFSVESGDESLINELLDWMQQARADFTNTFAALATTGDPEVANDAVFEAWKTRWLARRVRQSQSLDESSALMRQRNPAVIPRNHLVEAALNAASRDQDLSHFHRLLEVLVHPFDHERHAPEFRAPAPADAPTYRTFCGT
ncbi:MAG: protein adenylyltransferase SelO [Verrucomicrobiales bacterium]